MPASDHESTPRQEHESQKQETPKNIFMALKLILVEVERLLSRVPWHLPTMFVLPGTTQAHRQGVCGQGTHCRSSDQWMVTSDRKPDSQNTASFLWIPSKDLVESCWIIGNCNELTCMIKLLTTQSNLILLDVVLSQAVLVPLQLSALTLLVLLHGLHGMALWAFPCFLLVALWPNVYASCSDEECDDTAWLQVHANQKNRQNFQKLWKSLLTVTQATWAVWHERPLALWPRKCPLIGLCRTLTSLRSWGSCKTFAMENLWSWHLTPQGRR